jgi:seryl-tRNA synthetase
MLRPRKVSWSVQSDSLSAKYDLDTLKHKKGLISKAVAEKKKASKGADKCEEEIAESKALDS